MSKPPTSIAAAESWPALPLEEWKPTYHNLHMWMQMVGKVRLALTPKINHWWNVPLYVTARGLTTSPIPCGQNAFEIEFDFISHKMIINRSDGVQKILGLEPCTVADFYNEFMSTLRLLNIEVSIFPKPVEVADPIPFAEDRLYQAYNAEAAHRCWRILLSSDRVFKQFRARFLGKCSPVQFFWGSFDLAVTRFSGRRAPERPEADFVTREAYSHEVISAGWWPGGPGMDGPAFYSYTAPEPAGLADQKVSPGPASYHPSMKEFILPYDAVRRAPQPETELLRFLETTYAAGARLAHWPRTDLELAQPPAA
ncbi:MAG: hypothetical protein JOZ14_07575 [Acidobacteria bacterium]|nr:hypothetical protein [Acidobacteriota bacterium]